jgi:hypothetical protein
MSTDQLAVIICLCILLLTSGSGRFDRRARRSKDFSHASPTDLSAAHS